MRFNSNMKINFAPYKLTFKSNSIPKMPPEGIRMGYDGYDEYFTKHDLIRKSLEKNTALMYQKFYGVQKTEDEMNRMLTSWGLKPNKFTGKVVVPEYLNFESIGNNNFRGAIPWHENTYKKLKESGIECIVDVIGTHSIEESVKNAGLEYFKFSVGKGTGGFWDKPAFLNSEELKINYNRDNPGDFIANFIKFVRRMDEGRCFIGCEFGAADTTDALRLYKTFNANTVRIRLPFIDPDHSYKYEKIQNLFDKLTYEDKKALGWSEELIKRCDRDYILHKLHR